MNELTILNKLLDLQNLTTEEITYLFTAMADGTLSAVYIAAILTALRMKKETDEEISGFITAMRSHMVPVNVPKNAIDVCGTGGDNANTFNISTAVAFVVAGAGVPVAKHGNRAASSKCGSADVLEKLGIHITLSPKQAAQILNKTGMVFLFAPSYHPALKPIGAVRKELKIRTIFNFLGPFANPASVKRQIIGVPNVSVARTLAKAALRLNYTHLLIVTSDDGLDEISTDTPSTLIEIKNKRIIKKKFNPSTAGFGKRKYNELRGGTAEENALIIEQILSGEKGPRRDIVVLNSAAALYVAGKVKSIRKGIVIAEKSINSGSALNVLKNLIKESQMYA